MNEWMDGWVEDHDGGERGQLHRYELGGPTHDRGHVTYQKTHDLVEVEWIPSIIPPIHQLFIHLWKKNNNKEDDDDAEAKGAL